VPAAVGEGEEKGVPLAFSALDELGIDEPESGFAG
jgi:hypothetical protein